MNKNNSIQWVPPLANTHHGRERRIGVELEFAGLEPEVIATVIEQLFGGEARSLSKLVWRVAGTRLGDFSVELDWTYLKSVAAKQETMDLGDFTEISDAIFEFLTQAAEQLIPWEVVSPPLPMHELGAFSELVVALRKRGALGTRHSPQYAFGMHLNPELPDLGVETILNYFRAYLCLYDWIADEEETDLTRRVTNYIQHYDHYYIKKVIDPQYSPSLTTLIDDYLENNPTRNRSIDMLPLFAYLDEQRVRRKVKDPRVKPRPTLHYRLPNCDIDNPHWNIGSTWRLWMEVEKLAADPGRLEMLCLDYQQELKRMGYLFDSRWVEETRQRLFGDKTA